MPQRILLSPRTRGRRSEVTQRPRHQTILDTGPEEHRADEQECLQIRHVGALQDRYARNGRDHCSQSGTLRQCAAPLLDSARRRGCRERGPRDGRRGTGQTRPGGERGDACARPRRLLRELTCAAFTRFRSSTISASPRVSGSSSCKAEVSHSPRSAWRSRPSISRRLRSSCRPGRLPTSSAVSGRWPPALCSWPAQRR